MIAVVGSGVVGERKEGNDRFLRRIALRRQATRTAE
jgi:hypothetical protein